MKHTSTITFLLAMLMVIVAPGLSFAGGPGFNDNVETSKDDDHHDKDDDNADDEHNEVPLDGGLSFLAVAGAAYGVKRIRDNRKKQE